MYCKDIDISLGRLTDTHARTHTRTQIRAHASTFAQPRERAHTFTKVRKD